MVPGPLMTSQPEGADPPRQVRGRFAPSPSGRMHLGNALSALMAWLSARSQGGSMVLRIEDLDPRCRSRERAALIEEDLAWLGLDWDEGPLFQSERMGVYEEALGSLGERGLLYECFCSRAELHAASAPHASDGTYVYPGTCRDLSAEERRMRRERRPGSLRLRVPGPDEPNGVIEVVDAAAGPIFQVLAEDVGDFILRRSDGVPAYQLAVVVDDALMGVSEVVRGLDLLASAPRQRLLQRLLDLPEVSYGHVPLLVAPDGRRLSKRDGDLDLGHLREVMAPEQVVGILAMLAGLRETTEPVGPGELVGDFSWERVTAVGPERVVDGAILGIP